MTNLYTTRSSAIRAAKAFCKKLHGQSFEAAECTDFHILPDSKDYKAVWKFEVVNWVA
jgi:hypothetical protein